jgi:DNA-binding LacI/PurR family transcriptional regulator
MKKQPGIQGLSRAKVHPPQRVATAHDVARRAGVSQSAVSRAFTEGASIAEETRRKVVEAAQELGYRPNLIARSLITRRSNIIGIAMSYLENQFYPAVLEALSDSFQAVGYRILLFTSKNGRPSDPILDEVLRYRIDALVLASISLSSHFDEECHRAGIPVVLLNRMTESLTVSSVAGDNVQGARTIADFLAEGGHERFAFIRGLEDSSTSRDRERGFTEGLADRRLGAPLLETGHYDFEAASAATRRLLGRPDRPDAIFCANDHMAFAAMNVASAEFGLSPGQDISIVGFDDVGPAAWPRLGLTTYIQPIVPMAERVVEIIRHQLSAPDTGAVRDIVPGALVVRSSARLPSTGIVIEDGRRLWKPGETA